MYIGTVSGIVAILSLFLPIWIGKKSEGTGLKSRLLTFEPIVRKCSSCGKVSRESDFCKYCGAKID
jgi:recombinational DNA repair protein RecR